MQSAGLQLKDFLDQKVIEYNNPAFIPGDPISVPHRFKRLQDIEITAFWTAILSWGQRKTIINKATELFEAMDNSPYDFITNHSEEDLKKLLHFKHRTFNTTDTLWFIHFFKAFYKNNLSLEEAFSPLRYKNEISVQKMLINFHNIFFGSGEFPHRTKKHIPTPERKSSCKRINMFLRWMVRNDQRGVDFGLWKTISTSQLICPLDVHVERTARKLGLLERRQRDWVAAEELTNNLKQFDPEDPVKYDFALFGMGAMGEHGMIFKT